MAHYPDTVRFHPHDDDRRIGLPYPYTVPCVSDMFQEMYYWDTYFTNVGLLSAGNIRQAKNNVDNILFLVDRYGFMPNANLFSFLDRSQPPFLSQMVRDVFEATNDLQWLRNAYGILKKEYAFWQGKRCLPNGLNGYTGYQIDPDRLDLIANYGLTRLGYKPEVMDEDTKKTVYLALKSFCESGWDRTLKRMNRKYTAEEYLAAVNRIRRYMPDAAITTDIIVGFPGETEADFQESYDFAKKLALADAHIFKYSPRSGTPAAKMPEQVAPEQKEKRSAKLIALTETAKQHFAEEMLGKNEEVLFEQERSPGLWEGKTENYVTVLFESTENLSGKLRTLRLVSARNGEITAE